MENSTAPNNESKTERELDLELATFFWDEFKYRHEVFWKIIQYSVIAHTFLITAPFLPNLPDGNLALIAFPIIAAIFSYLSYRVLQSETARMSGPAQLHRKYLMKHVPQEFRQEYYILQWPVEKFTVKDEDINALIPAMLRRLITKRMRNIEAASKATLASVLPIAWFVYGVSSSIMMLLIGIFRNEDVRAIAFSAIDMAKNFGDF